MNEVTEIKTEVEEFPTEWTYYQLIGRYKAGEGAWFAAGQLRSSKAEAVHDNEIFKYQEVLLNVVVLPVTAKPELPDETD